MNQEPTHSHQQTEANTGQPAVPMWLIGLMMVLLLLGAIYFDNNGGWFDSNVYAPYHNSAELDRYQLPSLGNEQVVLGKRLFEANCALCHNTDGTGKTGQAPPLAGSEWVNAQGSYRIIHIPQFGLTGPIDVKGQTYVIGAGMAPMGAQYTPDELAAVLTYVRQAWGNKAPAVTPEQVSKVRSELSSHPQQYTVDELKKLPEQAP